MSYKLLQGESFWFAFFHINGFMILGRVLLWKTRMKHNEEGYKYQILYLT